MRVILTGGGTGGHIYPALAIGQAIKKEWPKAEILYVGTNKGLENDIVPKTNFSFMTLDLEGWQRKNPFQFLHAGWKAVKALKQADCLIKGFNPDLVIGTGGYVCLPVVWSAAGSKIPTLLHEQNVMPGLTNRLLSRRVTAVMVTFAEAKEHFSSQIAGKIYVTGLPIRPQIVQVGRIEGLRYFGLSDSKATLLVVGGSRGAQSINQAMLHVYRKLHKEPRIQIIHITGKQGYDEYVRSLHRAGIEMVNNGNIIVRPYLYEMEYALACADLCVARAGAAFLAEMTTKGIPGILVPYPYAAGNHQEYNARALEKLGAANVIINEQLTGQMLLSKIENIIFDEKRRNLMVAKSLKAGKPEAIENILQIVREVI